MPISIARSKDSRRAERALAWINVLEALRLEACLRRGYPGFARLLASLRPPLPDALAGAAAALADPHASVGDSIRLARELAGGEPPAAFPYLGSLHPDRVKTVREARVAKERRALHRELAKIRNGRALEGAGEVERRPAPAVEVDAAFDTLQFKLELEGERVEPPPAVAALVRSIVQDFGEMPARVPRRRRARRIRARCRAGDEARGRCAPNRAPPAASSTTSGISTGATIARTGACCSSPTCSRGDPAFVAGVRAQLRRRRSRSCGAASRRCAARTSCCGAQHEGDDIDFDAVVEAYADRASGIELSERLFVQRQRSERNIAVMFMVDMSGSTKGWINDAEREALVLLCEALEALGDRYAIYGFSGMTRKRCEIYRIKRFDEPY